MSKSFPTDKDNIINDLDDTYALDLSDEEYERLRKFTKGDLFLLTVLFARANKKSKV